MSCFGRLFGKKKKSPTADEIIQNLRETEIMLQRKQEVLESKIEEELNTIAINSKNKRVALQALKRKKRLEKQLQQIDGTLTTIEMQRETLENTGTNSKMLKTIVNANDALTAVNENMNVDRVHNIMETLEEQINVAQEISNAISNLKTDFDYTDLERELAELQEENLDIQEPAITPPKDVEDEASKKLKNTLTGNAIEKKENEADKKQQLISEN